MGRPFPVNIIQFLAGIIKTGKGRAFLRFLPLSVCGLVLLPGTAAAYRPFLTPDAGLEKPGYWAAALGLHELVLSGEENEFLSPSLILSRGMAKGWEAGIGSALRVYKGHDVQMGFGDTFAYVKHLFREGREQEKAGPSVAAEMAALLPSHLPGDDRTGLAAALSVTAGGRRTVFHGGAGLEFDRQGGGPGMVWGAAAEYDIGRGVSVIGEVNGGFKREFLPDGTVLAGFIKRTGYIEYDFGVRKGFSDGPDDIRLTMGATIHIGEIMNAPPDEVINASPLR